MMDLFSNLWSMGGSAGGTTAGASAAPTNMSQIKVQPQAMDLAGTIPAANAQVQYNPEATPGTDWAAIGKQGLMGLAQSTGGGGEQQAPMMQSPQFRGGQTPGDFKAEDISSANRAQLQKYAQVQGLMAQR